MPKDSKIVLELGNEFLFCNVFSFAIKSESIKREIIARYSFSGNSTNHRRLESIFYRTV